MEDRIPFEMMEEHHSSVMPSISPAWTRWSLEVSQVDRVVHASSPGVDIDERAGADVVRPLIAVDAVLIEVAHVQVAIGPELNVERSRSSDVANEYVTEGTRRARDAIGTVKPADLLPGRLFRYDMQIAVRSECDA